MPQAEAARKVTLAFGGDVCATGVNEAAFAAGDHRLIRHDAATIVRQIQSPDCLLDTWQEFQLIRMPQVIDFPVDRSIAVKEYHRL